MKYKLKLIKPKYRLANIRIPPLALLTLASLTPRDKFDIEIIDANVEKIKIKKADLVGITVCTVEAIKVYKIADMCRRKGAKVILGGIHASFLPKEAIKHADSVVIGEAENIWEEVLDDFIKGGLKKFYRAKSFPNLSKPKIVDYSFLKNRKYLFSSVQTTRGCPYNCDFCSVITFNGRKQRHKDIDDVVRQIKHIKKIRKNKREIFFLVDDNLTVDKKYAKSLFKAIIPLNVRWFAQLPVNFADDDELLELAYQSGLRVAIVGFESVNQESLSNVRKANTVKKYENLIKKLSKYRMIILGLFILGLDEDEKDVFSNTLTFCNKNKIPFAFFQIFRPLPGTPLFDKMQKENRILTYDWGKYDGVVYKPKNMTVKELTDGRLEMNLKFYSLKNMSRNFIDLLKYKFPFYTYLMVVLFFISIYCEWKKEQLSRFFSRGKISKI